MGKEIETVASIGSVMIVKSTEPAVPKYPPVFVLEHHFASGTDATSVATHICVYRIGVMQSESILSTASVMDVPIRRSKESEMAG